MTAPRPNRPTAIQVNPLTGKAVRQLKRQLEVDLERSVTFTEIMDALLATADNHRADFMAHLTTDTAETESIGETQ